MISIIYEYSSEFKPRYLAFKNPGVDIRDRAIDAQYDRVEDKRKQEREYVLNNYLRKQGLLLNPQKPIDDKPKQIENNINKDIE